MRRLLVALLLAGLSPELTAQVIEDPPKRLRDQWLLSFSGLGGIPVGDFRKHENGGGGLEVMVGFQPFRRQALTLRGQVDWLMYGRINRDVEEEWCDVTGCYTETVYYDSRQHMMFTFQGGPELAPIKGKWRPFAFALAGWTLFHSYANLGYGNPGSSPPSQNLFTSGNFSTSYGGGFRWVDEKESRSGAFELSAHITRNAKADYLTERGLTRTQSGSWVVHPVRGAANVLFIKAGFWIGPNVPWFER